MPELPTPGRHFSSENLPADLRKSLHLFRNLATDEEVLRAFSEAGIVLLGRPPFRYPSDLSADDRETIKRSLDLANDDEVDEAVTLAAKVMLGIGDLEEAARMARHPLVLAKTVAASMSILESQLRKVVPILRERGSSWTQIGAALGITKQSAWERFSGED
jgi:hypothetical protein